MPWLQPGRISLETQFKERTMIENRLKTDGQRLREDSREQK